MSVVAADFTLRLKHVQTIKTLMQHAFKCGLDVDWRRFLDERDTRIIIVTDDPLLRDFVLPLKVGMYAEEQV